MDLSNRQQLILNYIIKHYLDYGEPVGSKLIAEEVGVSSATIRNEMAELTELGFLEQPHTSAGRIPSSLGFRTFIKSKDSVYEISKEEKIYFDTLLSNSDPEYLLDKAAEALSHTYTCAVSTQGDGNSTIKAVQFVQISRRSAMLILLSSSGTIKTRLFRVDFDLNTEMLRVFFRVFNEKLMGLRMSDISVNFLQQLSISFGNMSALMATALMALYECAKETMTADVIVKGQTRLFVGSHLSESSMVTVSEMFQNPETFRSKFMNLPKQVCVIPGGYTVFPTLRDTGIVSSKYYIDGKESGVFVIIGPVRMDYPKIISQLKYVSDYVGNTLTRFINEEL